MTFSRLFSYGCLIRCMSLYMFAFLMPTAGVKWTPDITGNSIPEPVLRYSGGRAHIQFPEYKNRRLPNRICMQVFFLQMKSLGKTIFWTITGILLLELNPKTVKKSVNFDILKCSLREKREMTAMLFLSLYRAKSTATHHLMKLRFLRLRRLFACQDQAYFRKCGFSFLKMCARS